MHVISSDGLLETDYKISNVPVYLSDEYDLIDGPSQWAVHVATSNTNSIDTLKQYTTILASYLHWRDDKLVNGASNWAATDETVMRQYILYLKSSRDESGRPSDSSIQYYINRICDFFRWATKNGYKHYWDMDMKRISFFIKDRSMVNFSKEQLCNELQVQRGRPTHVGNDLDKFLTREELHLILSLFDDSVYAIIATIIFMTALRPKELMQLPYHGSGVNMGVRRYREDELPDLEDIYFEFNSKGKRRSIKITAILWEVICTKWMPIRQERALLYRNKYGKNPPNNALFLSKRGDIVSRKMLSDNFTKVSRTKEYPCRKRLHPYMLRHSFATYFMLEALKKHNQLGKQYFYNPAIEEELRIWMGHNDVNTTYEYYVHLVNRLFSGNDLIYDLKKIEYRETLATLIEQLN